MINIDLDNVNEEAVYRAFNVDGNEAEALNDSYLEPVSYTHLDVYKRQFLLCPYSCPLHTQKRRSFSPMAAFSCSLATVFSVVLLCPCKELLNIIRLSYQFIILKQPNIILQFYR